MKEQHTVLALHSTSREANPLWSAFRQGWVAVWDVTLIFNRVLEDIGCAGHWSQWRHVIASESFSFRNLSRMSSLPPSFCLPSVQEATIHGLENRSLGLRCPNSIQVSNLDTSIRDPFPANPAPLALTQK